MRSLSGWSLTSSALVALGISATTATPMMISAPVLAQVTTPTPAPAPATTAPSFADVPADYWALPFIQALAARNVIVGYPDGTYKPDQPVTRAELAAMFQKAFTLNPVRQLPPEGFRDVPTNYWAAPAIRSAYEAGFLSGYPNNLFGPNQTVSKADAITAVASGLNLTPSGSVEQTLANTYVDAGQIPSYAVNQVAAATQANLVVNYPDVRTLNPRGGLTRADAAALLYQALVRLGQVQPLPSNVAAANYIVGGTPQTTGDIVSIAEASGSFNTLTSLLRTAGLADALRQPGPYTLFAPTDQAFAALPPDVLQQLQQPENRETLIKILRYHVVAGELPAEKLTSGEVKTLEDAAVNIKVDNSQIAVNNASVVQPNVKATNGVVHVINQVLIPPELAQGEETEDEAAATVKRNYIAVAGNIGLGGNTALGSGNFAVTSKFGLTNNFSVRPGAVIGDDTVFLVPITYDFAFRPTNIGGSDAVISPYVGAGVAIGTGDDTDFGLLLTGGVDYPLSSQFMVTGAVNATFVDDTDVGIMLGIGYRF
ncbi:fasciclin domain-containing protein [Fischerella thermalis]|uniref:fasciclin domain-containing protein n=1 Tax=Fischerella thermalis TaxID=372787 RepID=UPI000C803391|nr:fasciclin domain-containing protein [Fischerella thermalis]MBF1988720.1 S-layer homology domain-containing protein [Fischerella thermalis M58_A2018_009]MBF2058923.1 S-layer homology domain-containing protein [Fischerella thermalis M66_A2018_004]MBF2069203.1 S-layer homology domain-containing protein [Fischerella thermalis M48_A2018_028]PLZ93702.1 beta-Ig-H3/fasciclin [Fischerella thermalis CCMEE 5194]